MYTLLELGTPKSLSISDMALEVQNKLNLFFDLFFWSIIKHTKKYFALLLDKKVLLFSDQTLPYMYNCTITLGVDVLHTFTLIYYHFGGPWAKNPKKCNIGEPHYLPQRLKSIFLKIRFQWSKPKETWQRRMKQIFQKTLILAFEVICSISYRH